MDTIISKLKKGMNIHIVTIDGSYEGVVEFVGCDRWGEYYLVLDGFEFVEDDILEVSVNKKIV